MATCKCCGRDFSAPKRNPARLYCSRQCRNSGAGRSISFSKLKKEKRSLENNGYYSVFIPFGHISRNGRRKKRHRAPEHIVVAEGILGRALKRGEVVHHINCDKLDNRPSNLLICTRAYHAWLHGEMSRRWAQEHLGAA